MIMRWTRFPLCRPFRAAANDLGTIAQRVTFAKNRNRRLRGSNTRRFEKNCRDYYQNRGSRSIFTRIEGYNAFITRFFNQQSLYLFFAQSLEHVSQTSRYICSDSRKQFLRKIDLSSRAGISVVIFRRDLIIIFTRIEPRQWIVQTTEKQYYHCYYVRN